MKALVCETYGPPEALRYRDIDIPAPGPGELLIETAYCGLNFPDSLIIQNKYQIKPSLPFIPGGEASGRVARLGPDVSGFAVGDRVAALTSWGAFAEYAAAKAAQTSLVPPSMDLRSASAFTLAYGTAHHALVQRAQVQPGEQVLVLGAAGGVGLAAVEIAKALGARVIAAASSAEKRGLARAHGADDCLDYTTLDLKAEVKRLTFGRGADVVFDPVGGKLAEPAFRAIAWGGRYLVIGFAGGQIPSLPLNLPLVKGASIVGVFWGDFVARSPELHARNMEQLYAWHAAGKLAPFISAEFPLARGPEAITQMMARRALGKIILAVNAPPSDAGSDSRTIP